MWDCLGVILEPGRKSLSFYVSRSLLFSCLFFSFRCNSLPKSFPCPFPEIQHFIHQSLVQNNKALLGQILKLVSDSANSLKRVSVDEQLREIKKLRREEPRLFK